jgi:arylsulfatase A-like enzyme
MIADYDSEVLQADRALARLWEYLDEHDLADDTLVVITADHGEGLWQRHKEVGELENGPSFFKPLLQGHGTQVYSEQVHVPLVVRGPGVPRGERVAEDVCLLDVLPTIFGRLGRDIPSELDGRDLFGDEPPPREVHTMCSRVSAVTLDGRWRLHVPAAYRVEKFGLEPELYDLAADPLELEPIDDPARTADLLQRMEDYRVTYAASGERAEIVAEEIEMLRGLGYAGEAAEAERLGAEPGQPGDEETKALESMLEEDAGDDHRH